MPWFIRHSPLSPLACRQVVELVTGYGEDTLDRRTGRRVAAHLARCEGCRTFVEQMGMTVMAISGARLTGLPSGVRAALLEAFHAQRTRRELS